MFYNDAIKDKFVDTEPVVEPEKAEEEEEKKDEEPEKEEKEEEEGEEGADNKEDTEVQDLKDHRTSLWQVELIVRFYEELDFMKG